MPSPITSAAEPGPAAAQNDDAQSALLRAVSHDLRTPLAAILGLAATLERDDLALGPAEAHDIARRIGSNARRLDRMVDDLVDLDRLRGAPMAPSVATTDIGALVSEVIATAEWLEGHQLDVTAPSVRAEVDRSKVERIVERLLENAARHAPEASSIRVQVERGDDVVVIVVEDEGPGVPEGDRDRVFRVAGAGEDAPHRATGMGVALTLVGRLAEVHGGRAWVQEGEDGGASFRVALPLVADPDRTAATT